MPAERGVGAGYWQLIRAGEPFRFLFPVGAAIGVAGVMMWPLYVWNVTATYPGQLHARIMIEGFLTAFVIGFLGTALPRLLDVPRLTLGETLGFAAAVLWTSWLQANGRMLMGDEFFLLTLLALVSVLGVRGFLFRQDVPPPGFILVGLGLASAVAGVVTQIAGQISPSLLPVWMVTLGRLLLYQGYLLFPVMGIGAFFLPRFFGLPGRQGFPESLQIPPGWLRLAGFALCCGGIVMAGFVIEALGFPSWGNALRAAGIVFYFIREIPVHRAGFGGGSLVLGLRVVLVSIPLALILMAIWPQYRLSLLHVLFITGFSLLVFLVATRVVLGHSGQSEKFRARIWPVLILTAMFVLAMVTRVSADWLPDIRMTHYAYAALCWAAGVAVWAFFILPGVRLPDTD